MALSSFHRRNVNRCKRKSHLGNAQTNIVVA